MSHPDTVLRFALLTWALSGDLAPVTAAWLRTRLEEHAPFTAEERALVEEPLLAWLDTADARAAAVVRSHLAGELFGPHHGSRSTEGMLKVAVIVQTLQEKADEEGMQRERSGRVYKRRAETFRRPSHPTPPRSAG